MSKRNPTDKAAIRERRNRMLDAAAAANLSLTEGVREMRAISGMTAEEFARHRGVSAQVIRALELGQGNPTVATLNRIGKFFGLEIAFVCTKRTPLHAIRPSLPAEIQHDEPCQAFTAKSTKTLVKEAELSRQYIIASMQQLSSALAVLDNHLNVIKKNDVPSDFIEDEK